MANDGPDKQKDHMAAGHINSNPKVSNILARTQNYIAEFATFLDRITRK